MKLEIEDIINLLKKKGFLDTFTILVNNKDFKIGKKQFYEKLNSISYYNSFYRIKKELQQKRLINITKENKNEYISLTDTGIILYEKLVELNEIVSKI